MIQLDYINLLPTDFDLNSKVWIYQSSRIFTISEALQIEDTLQLFVAAWNSHGTPVKGFATLLFGQFVVFIADETATGVSGCSTDSSVRVVKEIEQLCKVNMFDRQNLAFLVKEKIQLIPLNQFDYAIENAFLTKDTFYFNNTIMNLKDLQHNWIVPISSSWLHSKLLVK
jgi:hypothetical protein